MTGSREEGDEAPDEVEVDEGAAPATVVGDGVVASAGSCPDPERGRGREGRGSGGLLDPDWIERGESGATGG